MTIPTTSGPATASATEAVVGLHLTLSRERDVDHALTVLARSLLGHGVRVTWLSTHRTVTGLGAACSAAVTAATDRDLVAGYLEVVAREDLEGVGSFSTGRDPGSDAGARAVLAATARAGRTEGRAVWFPGHEITDDEIVVGDLLARTAVESVRVLGGGEADPSTVLQTRRHVRPRFEDGRLVLHTQPARGSVLVPFESPAPTPCCVDHA